MIIHNTSNGSDSSELSILSHVIHTYTHTYLLTYIHVHIHTFTHTSKVDEIVGLQEDMSAKIGVTIYLGMRPENYGYPTDMPQEEKSALQKKLREPMCAADGDLCKMLKMVEDKLAKTGTGYFVGDKPTIADCAFLPVCRQLRSGKMDFIPRDILDKYPKIVEFEAKMMALPAVKSHYA